MTNFTRIIFFVFLFSTSFVWAQEAVREVAVYKQFDKIIGQENTGLLNGTEYLERNRTINELHKYFQTQQYVKGSVFYDGQPYFEVDMRYNIWDDLLLVRIPHNQGEPVLELHKNKIESFEIDGHKFINVPVEASENDIAGFYEILAENDILKLLKKHKKKEKTILDKTYSYYEYKPNDPEYVLFFQEEYHEIDSRSDLTNIFPDLKPEIRKFYRNYRSIRKSQPDQFLTRLALEIPPQHKVPKN